MSRAEDIDAALDAVLRASGSALRNYTMPSTQEAMRKAMREAVQRIGADDALLAAMGHELAIAVEAYFAGECPKERLVDLANDVLK